MKRSLILLLLLAAYTPLSAQKFFDENWKKSSSGKACYIIESSNEDGTIHTIRIKKDGEITDDYAVYKTDDFSNGEYALFNSSGDTLSHMFYANSKLEGTYRYWKNGNTLYRKSTYKSGKEHGISEYYFGNGQISARYKMEDGNIIESEFWNEDGSIQVNRHFANFLPTFQGKREEAFIDWVAARLVYPQECVYRKIQGVVKLRIKIDENGRVTDVKVLSSPHKYMSMEATRVVMSSPPWTPGVKHNQICGTMLEMPVRFVLKD
jgi:TonB family protein